MLTAVIGLRFSPAFVCLSAWYLKNRCSWNHKTWHRNVLFSQWVLETHLFWSQKVKVTRHINSAGIGFCTVVSAGFLLSYCIRRCRNVKLVSKIYLIIKCSSLKYVHGVANPLKHRTDLIIKCKSSTFSIVVCFANESMLFHKYCIYGAVAVVWCHKLPVSYMIQTCIVPQPAVCYMWTKCPTVIGWRSYSVPCCPLLYLLPVLMRLQIRRQMHIISCQSDLS